MNKRVLFQILVEFLSIHSWLGLGGDSYPKLVCNNIMQSLFHEVGVDCHHCLPVNIYYPSSLDQEDNRERCWLCEDCIFVSSFWVYSLLVHVEQSYICDK